MVRRVVGLAAFVAAAAWPFTARYFWEFVRSVFYEQISKVLHVIVEAFPLGLVGQYGPSLLFAGTGVYLFYRTGHHQEVKTPDAVTAHTPDRSTVTKWFAPLQALDEFCDKGLLRAAFQALNDARAAKEARDAEFKDKSPYDIIRIDATNDFSKKANDAEIAFMFARKRVFDNLISQMKEGVLVGRALPFDDKKLEDRDWEIIKSSHWSVLRFEATDQNYETVSGGGRTYKGLQIGKHQ